MQISSILSGQLPEITTTGQSAPSAIMKQAPMLQNVDNGLPPITIDQTAPSTSVGTGERLGGESLINTKVIREVRDAKGKVIGLEQKMPDGKWIPYKSSVKNFKKVDFTPKKSVNGDMSVDKAIKQPSATNALDEYASLNITSKGKNADIEYLAKKAMVNGEYDKMREYWEALPDGNQYKEGMRSLMEKSLRPSPISKKKITSFHQ